MARTLIWIIAGAVLGAIIHLSVILALPALATRDVWSKVTALNATDAVAVLPEVKAGQPNPLRLDPGLAYAVCQVDLRKGPGVVSGVLPQGFWSLAVYNRAGAVIYSTTNRDGIGQTLMLAEQQLDIAEGLLIVESAADDVFAVIRLAIPHPVMRPRFEAALKDIVCSNIE
jgi:uncharacterized membrane protein